MTLNRRQEYVLMRRELGAKYTDLAKQLGVSAVRVRQIHHAAQKNRGALEKTEINLFNLFVEAHLLTPILRELIKP